MDDLTTEHTLHISGKPNDPCGRIVFAMGLVALGIFLWTRMEASWVNATERDMAYGVFAALSFIIAFIIPRNSHSYLDFKARQIVTIKHYAWLETARVSRPLTEFGRIVIRHLCHAGGEGPDTYTGSVGLKPLDKSPVLWVKNYQATQDEVPRESYEFARKLKKLTGLSDGFVGNLQDEIEAPLSRIRPAADSFVGL